MNLKTHELAPARVPPLVGGGPLLEPKSVRRELLWHEILNEGVLERNRGHCQVALPIAENAHFAWDILNKCTRLGSFLKDVSSEMSIFQKT